MKFFRCDQIKQIDEYTIQNEPIASYDLMERASGKLFDWFTNHFDRSSTIHVFTGPGNNGGDGLALARMLAGNRYNVEIYYIRFTDKTSADWEINRDRLENASKIYIHSVTNSDQFPVIPEDDIIVDAIFGSGLSRPAEGLPREIIMQINKTGSTVISIDVPSGLFGEDNSKNSDDCIIEADYTLTFQFPKLSFMFPENARYVGDWTIIPIGLSKNAIRITSSPYLFVEQSEVIPLLRKRNKFEHKGNFGHGLFIAGSFGKMGAAVLGAHAALRTGIGLLSCHVPNCGIQIMQCSLPEAMVIADKSEKCVSYIEKTDSYTAVGIGPGLGTELCSLKALHDLISECKKPIVIDADALNMLALDKSWLTHLPEGTVITPHPKEFERLAGKSYNSFNRLTKQIQFSKEYGCIVVLKGAHTCITTPGGKILFNSTGNPGMATGGSGDVLTGIILSLLAQGYNPENAAIMGVYLHGMAGDIAAEESCYESMLASDIINCIGKAFIKMKNLEF
jgi:ADP-dependent NAD(P)H-hydrate dehydratase / NAD(P)H-hydrate epimerase